MNWKTWLHGLAGAAIGGGASAIATQAAGTTWTVTGKVALFMAVTHAALYLQKSPIWSETTTTATLTETPDRATLKVTEKKEQ